MNNLHAADVVVTGIGIVSSIGHGVDDFWRNCLAGTVNVSPTPEHWNDFYNAKSRCWSPLPLPDFSSYGLRRSDILANDTASLIAIVAADDALETAGLEKVLAEEKSGKFAVNAIDSFRAGIFVGTGLGCITSTLHNHVPHILIGARNELAKCAANNESSLALKAVNEHILATPRVSPFASVQSMPNAIGANLSIRYGFRGPVETLSTACASGSTAIHRAFESIKTGRLDLALCGGSEYYGDHAGSIFMAFDRLGTLAHGKRPFASLNRPFDKDRSGFLFSQGGACFLLLESMLSATRRGAKPIARLNGSYATSDANSLAAISRENNSIERMILGALDDADLTTTDIQYVNTHGTSTTQNDEIESEILLKMFGTTPLVNSTKSLLGHTIGASGAIEAAVTALSLSTGEIHPSLNLDKPISSLNFARDRTKESVRVALTLNFGFGGHNVGLILTKI